MDYKYNEIDYAKKIYEEGFQSMSHMPTELRLVATYMKRSLGYKPQKLNIEFYEWCSKNIDNYNRVLHYNTINRAISQASKKNSTLIKLNYIKVYQQELDFIDNLTIIDDDGIIIEEDYNFKKLMFTLMCQLRINKEISTMKSTNECVETKSIFFKGGQKKYTTLKKLSKLPEKVKLNEDLIHYLYTSNLVTPMYNGLIRLDYMKELLNMNSDNSVSVLEIDEFDCLGWYYDYYKGKNKITKCDKCGKLFKNRTKNNSQKYCGECLKINPYYKVMESKIIKCVDCGKNIKVDATSRKVRCDECKEKHRNMQKIDTWNKNKRKYRVR